MEEGVDQVKEPFVDGVVVVVDEDGVDEVAVGGRIRWSSRKRIWWKRPRSEIP